MTDLYLVFIVFHRPFVLRQYFKCFFDAITIVQQGHPTGQVARDFVSDEEFDRLLDAWFGNFAHVLGPGRGFYIWGGYANLGNYPRSSRSMGCTFPKRSSGTSSIRC